MLGRRSLNLELANFDSEIERMMRDNRRIPPNSPADSQSSESESEKSVEMGEQNPPRSLRQLFALDATSAPSCLAVPDNATHFELKPSLLNNLPCFRGLENEDPYDHACGGHFSSKMTSAKILQSGLYWPSIFRDAHAYCSACERCQKLGSIGRRNMMPLNPIFIVELFDV
jgi:hypothetical protein